MKKFMCVFLSGIGLILTLVLFVMCQSKFGKLPAGKRLESIQKSPNYKKGAFVNTVPTPMLTEGVGYMAVTKEFIFANKERVSPTDTIPSTKTNLFDLDLNADVLVWFGHSSYFIQIDGKRILVDPVLSKAASPFSFAVQAYNGASVYTPADIPEIDYLFITHDHWDHLDYETVLELKPKIKKIICGLGVGEHLEFWGFDESKVIEKDWNEKADLDSGFVANVVRLVYVYKRIKAK